MDDTQMTRAADAGHALRPDWPAKSLRTFIAKNLGSKAYADVAVALAYVATIDPPTETPQLLLQPGPWWRATAAHQTDAERHPSTRPMCRICHSPHWDHEPNQRPQGTSPPTEYLEARAELKETP